MLVLAQQSSGPGAILLTAGTLIVLVVLGSIAVMWVRRWTLQGKSSQGGEASLLSSLRAMRDAGDLSDEEYDRARKRLASGVAGRRPERQDQRGS